MNIEVAMKDRKFNSKSESIAGSRRRSQSKKSYRVRVDLRTVVLEVPTRM